jgi:hypothetical protein
MPSINPGWANETTQYKREELHSSNGRRLVFRLLQWGTLTLLLGAISVNMLQPNVLPLMETPLLGSQLLNSFGHLQLLTIQYHGCSSTVVSTVRHFEFNVTAENPSTQQWRFLDYAPAELIETLCGIVKFERGNILQASDIEVQVIVKSTQEHGLQNINFDTSNTTLTMSHKTLEEYVHCIEVQVLVFLRPYPKRLLHLLEVRSSILDIRFDGSLAWHVDNLVTHTSHGDSWYEGSRFADPLTTQNITTSSVSGEIFGFYVANGHLKLHNKHGRIGFPLIPRYDGTPFNLESLDVSTISANIHARAEYEEWDQRPLTHRTDIHSVSGSVYVGLPLGSVTNISSGTGEVFALLQPFAADAPDARSEIYTASREGTTFVSLDNVKPDTLKGKFDPMLNTTSKHVVGEGQLQIRYPYSWYGNMEGSIESGSIEFDSSALDKFEKGEGWVKAKRGKSGESVMEARVGKGVMGVKLGI